jgi:hypothetical protein
VDRSFSSPYFEAHSKEEGEVIIIVGFQLCHSEQVMGNVPATIGF